MPTEVIYRIESVEEICTKIGSAMVVEDGTSFWAFATSCLKNNLRDFDWGDDWFIRPLVKKPSSRNPDQGYYHYEIM